MTSLPAALTWELFARGRWVLPAAALGSLAFPILLLSALAHDGALLRNDESLLMLHVIFVQFNALAFGGNLITLQWQMSRLYTLPASTARLVTWRLLPAMLLMGVETLAWTATINALFQLNWPLWGPALASAVVVAVAAAGIWLPGNSRWAIFLLTIAGAGLGTWFATRYGTLRDGPSHLWSTVMPAEVLTLAAIAAVAWRIAILGVARSRRGEPPFSLGLVARVERLFSRRPAEPPAFATPSRAQFWYAWRFGWLAPGVACGTLLMGLFGSFVAWSLDDLRPEALVEGVYACIMLVIIAAIMAGVALGNLSNRGDLVMGQFLATRPQTSADFASAILRTTTLSLVMTWAVWVAALLIAYGLGAAFGNRTPAILPGDWRMVPVFVVASWIVTSVLASALLTGHSTPLMRLIIAAFFGWIGFIIFAKYALSPQAAELAHRVVTILVGVACLAGTLWAFFAARRRALIESSMTWAALAAWAALVVAAALLARTSVMPVAGYILIVGVLALAVLPLAAAPLAIAWNRHR